jgi:cyanophycinase-like exopeptidase
MRPSSLLSALPLLAVAGLACSALTRSNPVPQEETPEHGLPGAVILCADGPVPHEALIEALARTGKDGAVVAVNRTAEQLADPAERAMWAAVGVQDLLSIDANTLELAKQNVLAADLIWLSDPGVDGQVQGLWATKLVEDIAERRANGAVVGGVGAVAESLCGIHLPVAPKALLQQGGSARRRGVGLWTGGVVDASFGDANAFQHLMTALLERPRIVGVGLEPGASICVADELRVLTGQAWVVDPRGCDLGEQKRGGPLGARGVELTLLRPNEAYADASSR